MQKVLYSLAALLFFIPAEAVAQVSSNESRWRASLETDIRNNASPSYICISATSSANASDDVQFKEWAYEVARNYCNKRSSGKAQPAPPPQVAATQAIGCRVPSDAEIKQAARGIRVDLSKGACVLIANPNRQDRYRR